MGLRDCDGDLVVGLRDCDGDFMVELMVVVIDTVVFQSGCLRLEKVGSRKKCACLLCRWR